MEENQVWDLVEAQQVPSERTILGNRWVYVKKSSQDGRARRYRARLVVQGFMQEKGVDYNETYAPVTSLTTVRLLLSLAVEWGVVPHQMDVKTAFLYGHLDEDVFMKQPEGYVDATRPQAVCKLKKSMYGLKQAPRQWYLRITDVLTDAGFVVSDADNGLLILQSQGKLLLMSLYVDDLLIVSRCSNLQNQVKTTLTHHFKMSDMGRAEMILGIEVTHPRDGAMALTQSCFIRETLTEFGMLDCSPTKTPMEPGLQLPAVVRDQNIIEESRFRRLIGKLMYLANAVRPDIVYPVSYLARFASGPSTEHWQAAKRVLRYLAGTTDTGIHYSATKTSTPCFSCYTDADWAGDRNDRKSTTGFVAFLNANPISWGSKKQSVVALSTMEAEFISASRGLQELLWLRKLSKTITNDSSLERPLLFCDNQSAIEFSNNLGLKERTKHIDIKYMFARDHIQKGEVELRYVPTNEMLADMMTKALAGPRFEELRDRVLHSSFSHGLPGGFEENGRPSEIQSVRSGDAERRLIGDAERRTLDQIRSRRSNPSTAHK